MDILSLAVNEHVEEECVYDVIYFKAFSSPHKKTCFLKIPKHIIDHK